MRCGPLHAPGPADTLDTAAHRAGCESGNEAVLGQRRRTGEREPQVGELVAAGQRQLRLPVDRPRPERDALAARSHAPTAVAAPCALCPITLAHAEAREIGVPGLAFARITGSTSSSQVPTIASRPESAAAFSAAISARVEPSHF